MSLRPIKFLSTALRRTRMERPILKGFGFFLVPLFFDVIIILRTLRSVKPLVSVAILACFSLSLFWCPDSACQVEPEDDCMCLICALSTARESDPPASSSHQTSCSCICQMSSIAPVQVVLRTPFYSPYVTITPALDPPKEPTEVILKPPIL